MNLILSPSLTLKCHIWTVWSSIAPRIPVINLERQFLSLWQRVWSMWLDKNIWNECGVGSWHECIYVMLQEIWPAQFAYCRVSFLFSTTRSYLYPPVSSMALDELYNFPNIRDITPNDDTVTWFRVITKQVHGSTPPLLLDVKFWC